MTAAQETLKMGSSGNISGARILLGLEGLAVLLLCIFMYGKVSRDWLAFALLFFAPDLTFIAFALGARAGTIAYNLMHTYTAPLLLAGVSLALDNQTGVALALIWAGHCGMDRAVGYGLKYVSGFKDTHLGRV